MILNKAHAIVGSMSRAVGYHMASEQAKEVDVVS